MDVLFNQVVGGFCVDCGEGGWVEGRLTLLGEGGIGNLVC